MKYLFGILLIAVGLLVFLAGATGFVFALDHPTGQFRDLLFASLCAAAMLAGALAGLGPLFYLAEEA